MDLDAKQIIAHMQLPFVCTVVHTIPWDEVYAEGRRIEAALHAGGYAKADQIEMVGPATDALVGDLFNILLEHKISGFSFARKSQAGVGVVVTVEFKDAKDAVLFKLALP